MRGFGKGNRSLNAWLKDGASVAIRSCVLGAVLGGLLAAVVAATEPMYAWPEWRSLLIALLRNWAIAGAIVAVVMGLAVSIVSLTCAVSRDGKADDCLRGARLRAQSRRSRLFWRAYWASLPVAACLSLIPLWRTHGAYQWGGCECVGWPIPFYALGGITAGPHYYFLDLTTDVAIWLGGAVAAGLLMRYGAYRLGVKAFQFLRGRLQQGR
jgi:hypothetical protein